MTVVGFLAPGSLDTYPLYLAAFRKGLNKLGFVEGQNVAIEYRWAEGQYDRFPEWQPVSWTNELVDRYRAGNERSCERLWDMFRLPDFSVVVWLRRTDEFVALKAELLGAAVAEPYELTEYQGMVDFHWSAANLPEAKRLAAARGARAAAGDASDRIPQRRLSFFLWPPEKTARQVGLR